MNKKRWVIVLVLISLIGISFASKNRGFMNIFKIDIPKPISSAPLIQENICPTEDIKSYLKSNFDNPKTALEKERKKFYPDEKIFYVRDGDKLPSGYVLDNKVAYIFYSPEGYGCRVGSGEGENINYKYCEPTVPITDYPLFCLKKTIISEEGTIERIIEKCVYKFVVDPRTLDIVSVDCGAPRMK